MAVSRRSFLLSSGATITNLGLFGFLPRARAVVPESPSTVILPYLRQDGRHRQKGVAFYSMNVEQSKLIQTPFVAHHILVDPDAPTRGFGVAKYGHHILEFDLAAKNFVRAVESEQIGFYGHIYLPRGRNYFYATGVDTIRRANEQFLYIFDKKTLKKIDQVFICNDISEFHDVEPTPTPNTIVTASRNKIYFIDTEKGKVSSQYQVELPDPTWKFQHVAVAYNGDLAIEACKVDSEQFGVREQSFIGGGIASFSAAKKTLTYHPKSGAHAELLNTELFGLCFNNDASLLLVTARFHDKVTVWNFANKEIIGIYDAKIPCGVSLTKDRNAFVVGTSGGLQFYSAKTGLPIHTGREYQKSVKELYAENTKDHFTHSTVI